MTEQSDWWGSEFGSEYMLRNPRHPDEMQALYLRRFGMDRTTMNEEFLHAVPRDARILEVGCNVGVQLNLLARMGFTDLHGVEINPVAVEHAEVLNTDLPIVVEEGTALDLPFADASFDLVYTSGVLIHIHPDDLARVQREMVRCASRWIWGLEYYADNGHLEIPYRGQQGLLWKTDFAKAFLANAPGLRLAMQRLYTYLDEPGGVQDQMYLLERQS
ncbi:MAG: methyltransferase domain-containing protein [Coriobacteriia bacterium]|nr:methyltransferase domain-containing protein [Coriobacteriia bacterium]